MGLSFDRKIVQIDRTQLKTSPIDALRSDRPGLNIFQSQDIDGNQIHSILLTISKGLHTAIFAELMFDLMLVEEESPPCTSVKSAAGTKARTRPFR
jgi:hypothetical protein